MRYSSFSELSETMKASCAYIKDHETRDIHPVTSRMDVLAVVIFGAMYWKVDQPSVGQHVYFIVQICLYMASSFYHGYRWCWVTRFLDQSCIGLYIIVCPLPFLPNENWVWAYVITASTFCIANKWLNLEKSQLVGSMIFLTFGVVSMGLLYTVGMPHIGTPRVSSEGFKVALVVSLFVLKLWIFQTNRGELVPGYIGNAETCHMVMFIPMMLMSTLVASL